MIRYPLMDFRAEAVHLVQTGMLSLQVERNLGALFIVIGKLFSGSQAAVQDIHFYLLWHVACFYQRVLCLQRTVDDTYDSFPSLCNCISNCKTKKKLLTACTGRCTEFGVLFHAA